MKIARLRMQKFRGFEEAIIVSPSHVAVVGEPRAGRTDLVEALQRVLDPRSTSSRVKPLDIHLPIGNEEPPALTEVEVTLIELGNDLEQLLDPRLEAIDPETGLPATADNKSESVLGVRLCYRARYDDETDTGEHWVDYPRFSDPSAGVFIRAPRLEREALPFLMIRVSSPLQIRAEGDFRALMAEQSEEDLDTALVSLRDQVADATQMYSETDVLQSHVKELMDNGAGLLLETDDPASVRFVPEDGSLAALLRSIQPAIDLDAAGPLPLSVHGSTATSVLAVSEAAASAKDRAAIIVVDDFGDNLDASSAEYLSTLLRRKCAQLWATTRRGDVVRAFEPEEILRLTRSSGTRLQHRLAATTDRKERGARRHLLDQLLGATTCRTVVLLEGPHDVEGYGALADRLARIGNEKYLPSAHGSRLIAPPGQDGGKDQIPRLAELAAALGFRVRVVLDSDKPGEDEDLYDAAEEHAEQLTILPERTAVERALVHGLALDKVRSALTWLVAEYALGVDVSAIGDHKLEREACKLLKAKGGLHRPWVEAIDAAPPIASNVLLTICSDKSGRVEILEPS